MNQFQPLRRDALKLMAASLATLRLNAAGAAALAPAGKPFVTSDIARLRRVLMCPPGREPIGPQGYRDDVIHLVDHDTEAVVAEHAELMRALRSSGAEVLLVPDLLGSAIEHARSGGVWDTWLRATHPKLAADSKQVTAERLLGRDPALQYRTWPDGSYRHGIDEVPGFIFTRDTAVTFPDGIVLLNVGSPHRVREQVLVRFMFDHAPELARYPVVFDAKQQGLLAEGGDFQLVDEHTLFLGVGNRTDPRVAPLLARELKVDVLAVQTRKAEWLRTLSKKFPLRGVFLHLDSYFTHVADRQVLTLPWFLEAEHSGKDPYLKYLDGMAADSVISDEDLATARDFMKDFGWVRLYRGGSGEQDLSVKDMKLVDYVRSRGYTVHFVGGPPPSTDTIRHLFTAVLYEHERQGANVVATAPGHVVAYEGASRTHAALRKAGISVTTFPAREIWPWDGGPHCLTMPLERG